MYKKSLVVIAILLLLVNFNSSESQIQAICNEPKSPGICRGRILRYAYDKTTGHCIAFYYTGCAATGNNFLTYEECRRECMKKVIY